MKNPIRETLAAGRPSVGAWLNLASPLAAEVMAAAGFPWLVVDTEHSAFDLDLIAHTFRAIEARGALACAWTTTRDHGPAAGCRRLGIVVRM
jgi:4-hydroxy-2-oxoheptanedioate aldolase